MRLASWVVGAGVLFAAGARAEGDAPSAQVTLHDVAVSVRASAIEASTRPLTSPSVIWRSTIHPADPTTRAVSTTMAVTTRLRSDRRQKPSASAGARRRIVRTR